MSKEYDIDVNYKEDDDSTSKLLFNTDAHNINVFTQLDSSIHNLQELVNVLGNCSMKNVGELEFATVEQGNKADIAITQLNEIKPKIDNIPTSLSQLTDDSTHRLVTDDEKDIWNNKANTTDIPTSLSNLTDDSTHRLVTDDEKTTWNNKPNTTDIPDSLSELADDSTHRLVTDTEKTTWNNKADSTSLNNYMIKDNPTGTGSFSMNRKSGTVVGDYSVAEGDNNTASGESSHAEGAYTTASGIDAHAEGTGTKALSQSAHSEGYSTTASALYSHAEGESTTASGSGSHAEGKDTEASGDYSHAAGFSTKASSDYQYVIGKYNEENTDGSKLFIVGNGSDNGSRNNAFTVNTTGTATVGADPVTNMDVATKKYVDEHTVTIDSELSTSSTNPVQNKVITNTLNNKANTSDIPTALSSLTDDNTHRLVTDTEKNTWNNKADSDALNNYMNKTDPMGTGSFSMNRKAGTVVGDYSHAEGNTTTASGEGSHAEGFNTQATAYIAHAEGYYTKATGASSHTEGYLTVATGSAAHAEGWDTRASGNYSHAAGNNTIASSDCQYTIGKYNKEDSNAVFIVGNGVGDSTRNNIFTVNTTGTATVGAAPVNDMDVATKKYVDDNSGGGSVTVDSELSTSSTNPVQNKVITNVLNNKADNTDIPTALSELTDDSTHRLVTDTEKTNWNNKANSSDIPTALSSLTDDSTHRLVTDTEKTNWNNKVDSDVLNNYMNKTDPVGTGSFSMNRMDETVVGNYSVTEGYNNTASADYSHAEGEYTIASGLDSHAEGIATTASGKGSHAEGDSTTASGQYSHAAGYNTTASSDYQYAIGKYNKEDSNAVFIVGNGIGSDNKKNIFTANSDGTATVGAAPVNDMDVATKKYVDDNSGGGSITVDSELSTSSTNPVQNKIITNALNNKANTSDIPTALSSLTDDSTHRLVTDTEKDTWNNKANTSDIPTALSELTDDSTHRLVTDTEKNTWNNKADISDIPSDTVTSVSPTTGTNITVYDNSFFKIRYGICFVNFQFSKSGSKLNQYDIILEGLPKPVGREIYLVYPFHNSDGSSVVGTVLISSVRHTRGSITIPAGALYIVNIDSSITTYNGCIAFSYPCTTS